MGNVLEEVNDMTTTVDPSRQMPQWSENLSKHAAGSEMV